MSPLIRNSILAVAFLACSLVTADAGYVATAPFNMPASLQHGRGAQIPTGLGWALSEWTPKMSVVDDPIAPVASFDLTPEQIFALFSTALSAPSETYFVNNSTGNDGNNCTSSGTACLTMGHAVTLANAAGSPATIFVASNGATIYTKGQNPTAFNTIFPTVDIAWVATGGRVISCTCDAYSAPSVDATYTNTYSMSDSNVDEVVDVLNLNQFGDYTPLSNVSTAAIANVTPNSWALVGGTIYIRRIDGVAVTNSNTRVYRSSGGNIAMHTGQVNIYIGGQTASDGFDFEGGDVNGALSTSYTSVPGSDKAIIVKNSSFSYDGQTVNTAAVGFSINSLNGLAACFNCRADGNATDGYNNHVSGQPTAINYFLIANSSASNNGIQQQSSNCITSHETSIAIFVAIVCTNNHGGSARSINSAKALITDTIINNDLGDYNIGGGLPPTAVQTDNTAQYWLDDVRINMPGGNSRSLFANSGTTILTRNMLPPRQPYAGTGTIGTW